MRRPLATAGLGYPFGSALIDTGERRHDVLTVGLDIALQRFSLWVSQRKGISESAQRTNFRSTTGHTSGRIIESAILDNSTQISRRCAGMDELVHHCVRELAFDGDLGCDVSRLRDFISDFYARDPSTTPQVVDDSFCAFVWSVVVQQPGIRVGTLPEGVHSEVYIAPQLSTKRKGKGKDAEETDAASGVASLVVIPDSALRPLEDLKVEFGDNLRIAVDPETSFRAITGSHIRPAKLTPMVYTCLQLVSRGREDGISVVDLSKKTGYDAKTCHYLVEKLVELDYIEKRKKSGVGSNFCIHKYFFERSATWKTVLAEEAEANAIDALKAELDEDVGLDDEIDGTPMNLQLAFDPIDLRHLSSTPLVRSRVIKLLKNSPHNMHTMHNLLATIGFANPNKTDRRFFATRLRELMAQGLIEKVQVPNVKRKGALATCIRLLAPSEAPETGVEQSASQTREEVNDGDIQQLKANSSLHKQILDLIHSSGTKGVTLNDLSSALCNFDKRIIELLLSRMEKYPPPPHLTDLAITQITESHGRERRFRYFSLPNYRIVAEREKIDPSSYSEIDLSQVRDFMPVDENQFYEEENALNAYIDRYHGDQPAEGKTPKKRPNKNPVLPDGTVKKGRPRKQVTIEEPAKGKSAKKRKRGVELPPEAEGAEDGEQGVMAPLTKRRKGQDAAVPPIDEATVDATDVEPATPEVPQKKKRGRPPKKVPEATPQVEQTTPTVTKRRGRPRKATLPPELLQHVDVPSSPSMVPSGPSATRVSNQFVTASPPDAVPSTSQHDIVNQEQPSGELPPGATFDTSIAPALNTSSEIPIDPLLAAEEPPDRRTVSSSIPTTPVPTPGREKRSLPDVVTPGPPLKRTKSGLLTEGTRTKTNLSQSRREKEILRVISDNDGIVSISSKEFLEAHAALLDSLIKCGEQVSTIAGSRIDKRTVDSTLKALESRGKVKFLSTIIATSTGASRTVKIAYLPEISPETLSAFLSDLSRQPQMPQPPVPVKTLTTPVEYGGIKVKAPALPTVVSLADRDVDEKGNAQKAEELFRQDEDTIRDSLLTERSTVAQLYGYIPGKAARARELHLAALHAFTASHRAPSIVSTEQRIIHLSYFYTHLSSSAYCSFVSCLTHNEELLKLLDSTAGRSTPVGNLPRHLYNLLQPSRSRSQARILDLLDFLQALHLVVPLESSTDPHAEYQCDSNDNHPTTFSTFTSQEYTTLNAPQYWHFTPNAPIHLWARSETEPPFWKSVSISSKDIANLEYWKDLEHVCLDYSYTTELTVLPPDGTNPANVPLSIIKTLRRPSSWKDSYSLSWYQKEYLKLAIDNPTGNTPLQDTLSGQTRLTSLAKVISAPREIVKSFYASMHEKRVREIERMKRRARKKTEEEKAKEHAEEKAVLAKRAGEARLQREREFDEMVRKICSEPPKGSTEIRIRRIRTRFMQSGGTDPRKWETEVGQAIEEAKMTAKKVMASSRPSTMMVMTTPGLGSGMLLGTTMTMMPPPMVASSSVPEKSIEDLIAQQGPPLTPKTPKKKTTKGKEKEQVEEETRRRHRFQWNKDYDELARDASAIIKARCRDGKRLDWSALEQVFPAVPRNSVRQRITALKTFPGAETYFKRLEDKFYELWIRHRGTEVLVDEDPESVSNFSMVEHLRFLRNHVDKNALRVGFLESEQTISIPLPSSIEEFERKWKVIEKPQTTPAWDFLWTLPSEEAREKLFLHEAITTHPHTIPEPPSYPTEPTHIADAALKMALGTPNESYDSELASSLLKSVGEHHVKLASTDLLERGVLSKLVRDPSRPKPGRTLRISEANQNALGGPLSRDLFQDATALEELLSQQDDSSDWREWSLLAGDGDAAALIELVSENKIEFKIDTSHAQAARTNVDWNSKKADDDDIETVIQVRCVDVAPSGIPPTTTSPIRQSLGGTPDVEVDMEPHQVEQQHQQQSVDEDDTVSHGTSASGEPASCRQFNSTGLVDCAACLGTQTTEILNRMNAPQRQVAKLVLACLRDAGQGGITKRALLDNPDFDGETGILGEVIDRLSEAEPPVVFWTGYKEISLISCVFLKDWTVMINSSSEEEGEERRVERIFPRRWLDVRGRKMGEVWEGAVRAVMGVVVLHPGISQDEIRWRLRTVYDREEMNDVLRHLLREGYIRKDYHAGERVLESGPADDEEEKRTFWRVGSEKHWYQV